ncbi:MAG: hypothetical protein HY360_15350 [Verrucomicrobia bacterium]|nr:hypothetical protein [Verrucomicrobiota bacterium]
MKTDQLVQHIPAANRADNFYAPAQPWLAALDKAKTLLLAMHITEPAFPADALYFSWTGPQLGVVIHSMETIFPLIEFKRGETRRCRFNLLALRGFDDVDYVSSSAIISLKDPPLAPQVSVKEWPVEGKLATPAGTKPRELLLWFESDKARSNEARVVVQNPGPERPSSFSARIVFKDVPSGRHILRGRLFDEQGQPIEEFTFLGYAVTFTP